MLTLAMNIRLGAAITAAAIMAVGCSSGAPSSAPSSSVSTPAGSAAAPVNFNDADVAFTEAMYGHHAQAIEMVEMASSRAESLQVRDLARRIARVQDHDMGQMLGVLRMFGRPEPTDTGSMSDMPGMMSLDQMKSLERLSGSDFDRMWLSMMIDHHVGALAMSSEQLERGINPNTRGLASSVIASQKPEIAEMRKMLG